VAVHRQQPLSVIDDHGIAIEEVVAGVDHGTLSSCMDRRADGCCDIHAGVRIARLAIEYPAQAKGAGAHARYRLQQAP